MPLRDADATRPLRLGVPLHARRVPGMPRLGLPETHPPQVRQRPLARRRPDRLYTHATPCRHVRPPLALPRPSFVRPHHNGVPALPVRRPPLPPPALRPHPPHIVPQTSLTPPVVVVAPHESGRRRRRPRHKTAALPRRNVRQVYNTWPHTCQAVSPRLTQFPAQFGHTHDGIR